MKPTKTELLAIRPMLNTLGRFPTAFIPKGVRPILQKVVEAMTQERCQEETVVLDWVDKQLR